MSDPIEVNLPPLEDEWEVEIRAWTFTVRASTEAKARWQGVNQYRERFGYDGSWPNPVASRVFNARLYAGGN